MNKLIPFAFQDVKLKESCWIEGKPYFTPRAIGEWLEYRNPQRAVRFIIERNPHIRQFATMFKLNIVEGGRTVSRDLEVYDPIGLQLIINKSNQPKALAFQIAVAHLVVAYVRGEIIFTGVKRIPEPLTIEGIATVAPYTRGIGEACRRLSIEMNKSPRSVRSLARKIQNGEPIRQPKQSGMMMVYVHRKHRDKYDEVLRLRAMGWKLREISEKTGVALSTCGHWTGGKKI